MSKKIGREQKFCGKLDERRKFAAKLESLSNAQHIITTEQGQINHVLEEIELFVNAKKYRIFRHLAIIQKANKKAELFRGECVSILEDILSAD